MSIVDVDDDALEVAPPPVSTVSGRFLFAELRAELDRLARKLDVRTRRIRAVLVRHDERLDAGSDALSAIDGRVSTLELGARAARVTGPLTSPSGAPRGALVLVAGDDSTLYVSVGPAKDWLRVPLAPAVVP